LGGNVSTIGLIMGVNGLSMLIVTPLVGVFVDKWDKRIFLFFGGLLMSLTTLPFAYFDTITPYFHILRLLQGLAFSLSFVSAGTLVVDFSPSSKRAQALGIFGIFSIINYSIAPYIGNYLVTIYGFKTFFIFTFVLGLMAPFIAIFIKHIKTDKSIILKHEYYAVEWKYLVIIPMFTMFVLGSGFITTMNFVPIFSKVLGANSLNLFFISYTSAVLLIRIFGGWIPDKYGKANVSAPSLLIFAFSIFFLSTVVSDIQLIISGVIFGFGHGILYPSIYAIIIETMPSHYRGFSFALSSVSFTSGGMIGSFAYGYIGEYFGLSNMFLILSVVCFTGSLPFILQRGKNF